MVILVVEVMDMATEDRTAIVTIEMVDTEEEVMAMETIEMVEMVDMVEEVMAVTEEEVMDMETIVMVIAVEEDILITEVRIDLKISKNYS